MPLASGAPEQQMQLPRARVTLGAHATESPVDSRASAGSAVTCGEVRQSLSARDPRRPSPYHHRWAHAIAVDRRQHSNELSEIERHSQESDGPVDAGVGYTPNTSSNTTLTTMTMITPEKIGVGTRIMMSVPSPSPLNAADGHEGRRQAMRQYWAHPRYLATYLKHEFHRYFSVLGLLSRWARAITRKFCAPGSNVRHNALKTRHTPSQERSGGAVSRTPTIRRTTISSVCTAVSSIDRAVTCARSRKRPSYRRS